ncbi:FecR family protein [Quatrionicoccus australiensis]|uniref:FecR family protein n=1 Tax=Quatrionicoccus australiensis TaxID=138118 RepID=UPI001CF9C5DA|nr:FecR domain-containing protein [Quatrionicoccus australiensis]MCB4360969.1 FecR domain-containing protein [Quatrionicoccus australiensis]
MRPTPESNEPAGHGAAERLAEEAATWFLRMRSPAVDAHAEQHFRRWLGASESHRREYGNFEKLWGALDSVARPRPRQKRRTGGALAIVAALALGMIYHAQTVDRPESSKIGEVRHLMLEDGSQVELDAASELRVEYTPWRRHIELVRGQALFKVAPGWRPFEVQAAGGSLRDIGTTFNVLQDEGKVSVAVAEGAVEISLADGRQRQLHGGEQASYQAGEIAASRVVNPLNVGVWQQERWIFEDASLGEVVRQINRQHARPLCLAGAGLENYRVSGVFDRSDRAGLLKALTVLLPLRIEEKAEATQLRRR